MGAEDDVPVACGVRSVRCGAGSGAGAGGCGGGGVKSHASYVESTPELDAVARRMALLGRCSGQASGEAADRWFPIEGSTSSDIRRSALAELAQEACAGCPVLAECGQWAVATRQRYGIWGGMAEHEVRAAIRKQVRAARVRRTAAAPVVMVQDEAATVELAATLLPLRVVEAGRAAPMTPVYAPPAVAAVA